MLAPAWHGVVATAEGGKIWALAKVTNGACHWWRSSLYRLRNDKLHVEMGKCVIVGSNLSINNAAEQTCGITLSLMRLLHISSSLLADKPPPDISDLVTQVDFRGPECSLSPGIEGVASFVVDVPRHSHGSRCICI